MGSWADAGTHARTGGRTRAISKKLFPKTPSRERNPSKKGGGGDRAFGLDPTESIPAALFLVGPLLGDTAPNMSVVNFTQ